MAARGGLLRPRRNGKVETPSSPHLRPPAPPSANLVQPFLALLVLCSLLSALRRRSCRGLSLHWGHRWCLLRPDPGRGNGTMESHTKSEAKPTNGGYRPLPCSPRRAPSAGSCLALGSRCFSLGRCPFELPLLELLSGRGIIGPSASGGHRWVPAYGFGRGTRSRLELPIRRQRPPPPETSVRFWRPSDAVPVGTGPEVTHNSLELGIVSLALAVWLPASTRICCFELVAALACSLWKPELADQNRYGRPSCSSSEFRAQKVSRPWPTLVGRFLLNIFSRYRCSRVYLQKQVIQRAGM